MNPNDITPRVAAGDLTTNTLKTARQGLLRVHKLLLEVERVELERSRGRLTPNEYLQAVLNDPAFEWLRPASQLIVQIDEALDFAEHEEEPVSGPVAATLLAQVRALLTPVPPTTMFASRYLQMLQRHPEVVFAHRDLMAELPKGLLGPLPALTQ
ncbi:MAG: hypothetical protein KGL93_11745 [Gemmatimonadota bacterium]|nr:hypothetical protein [Gemmatimonadota bacterium]HEU4990358.1 hypothetical protein [Gemmatimonadaceae bacterium]